MTDPSSQPPPPPLSNTNNAALNDLVALGFPQTPQSSVGLSVHGQSIERILTLITNALVSQQSQLDQHGGRISNSEQWVQHISDDLQLTAPSRRSTYQQLEDLRVDTQRLERHRRAALCNTLAISNKSVLQATYLDKWYYFFRARKQATLIRDAVQLMAVANTKLFMRSVFVRMQHYVRIHKRNKRQERTVRAVALNVMKNLAARYFRKFETYHYEMVFARKRHQERNREISDRLACISQQSLMMRYFFLFRGYHKRCAVHRARLQMCDAMGVESRRCVVSRYYMMWNRVWRLKQLRKHQGQIIWAMASQCKELKRRMFMHKWVEFRRNRVRQRLGIRAVENMCSLVASNMLRRYYKTMMRYVVMTQRNRDRAAVDTMFQEVSRRCDSLHTRIDVGLKSMGNTNSVMNKLVDRLISVDDAIDALERDKVSRRELGIIAAHDPPLMDGVGAYSRHRSTPQPSVSRPAIHQRKDITPTMPLDMSPQDVSQPQQHAGEPEVDSIVQRYLSARQRVSDLTTTSSYSVTPNKE
eukprot:PhM_4_TR16432/c0_g3_i1/m.3713